SLTTSNGIVLRSDGTFIPDDKNNVDWVVYQTWLSQNNVPTPLSNSAPVISCALWQLQATLSANQWTNALSFVASSNNANLIAFVAHGSNLIPSNSTTLAQIAEAIGISSNS